MTDSKTDSPAPASQFGASSLPSEALPGAALPTVSTPSEPAAPLPSASAPPVLPPTASSPVDDGAASAAEARAKLLESFESELEALFEAAKEKIDAAVAGFETKLAAGTTEIDLITNELKKGGVVGRLHGVEMALAAHAAPVLNEVVHGAHDILVGWFEDIRSVVQRVAAGKVEEKAAAAAAPVPAAPPASAPAA